MTQTSQRGGGPIRLTASSATALRPATAAEITGGLWADRRRVNREVSIPAWLEPAAPGRQLPQLGAGCGSQHRQLRQRPAVSGQRRVQVAGGGRLGARRSGAGFFAGRPAAPTAGRDRAAAPRRPAARRLPRLALPGAIPRRTVRPAAVGTRALLRRTPDPGGRGAAPDHRRPRPPRGGSARGGPGRRHVRHRGGQGRWRVRTPGDRDRTGGALPGDRRRVIPGTGPLFRRPAWARTAR